MAKDWMKLLQKHEGAVVEDYDPFSHTIRTPSPSVNFCFGNTHGLPQGFTLVLYGPPKGGKSVICNSMIGQLHKDDPNAIAIKFNTEMREMGQLTAEQAKVWGIDRNRYIAYDVNQPELIFDFIEKEVNAYCQDGMPLKLIVIDSATAIQGRRAQNADSILTQQIGDHALTIQDGLKRILAIQRRHKLAVVITTHVRAEMDQLEKMRGNNTKMAASYGLKHHAEYFMMVEPWNSKEGKTDLLGNKLENENLSDAMENAERTGHKIRVAMKDSSMGPKGRVGVFTLDYHRGIINVHEEVFLLGVNRGVIQRPNNMTYMFGEKKWNGKQAMLDALKDDGSLREAVLKQVRMQDVEMPLAQHSGVVGVVGAVEEVD